MSEVEKLALVRLAINCHETKGCLEYVNLDLVRRISNDLNSVGNARAIRALLVNYILGGGLIELRLETREEYQNRREYWFRVRVPVIGSPRPLFYELDLTDDDPDYPTVIILNVHF